MKRKHFILAFMAMLSFAFSAFAQQTVVVRNFAELKAEIEKTATESRANNMRGVNVTNQGTPSEIFGDIKLGDNIVMEGVLEIPLYRELTLDLNGFTISGDADEYIKNLGAFSVQDNSANGTGAISCAIINGEVDAEAYLKIQNGTFKNQDGRADAAVITNYSLCEIYGGKFFSENIAMINHGEMSIDGGRPANVYIEGKNHYITNHGTLAVKNATIAGAKDDYVGNPDDFEDTVIFYNVAVNGKGYDSLSEAVAAATDGDLIRLFANVEESNEVVVDKAVTIDGNNKTLTSTSTGNAIEVNAEGIVSITDITVEGAAGYALDAVTETYVTESTLRGAGAVKVKDCLVSIQNTDLVGTAAKDVVSVAGDVTFNFEGGSITASSQEGADKFFIVGGKCADATFSIMAPTITLGAAANYLNVDTEKNVVKVFSGHETAFNQKGYVTEKKANFMYVYSAVARVWYDDDNFKNYRTLAAALDAATSGSTVELLYGDYDRAPISMAGTVCGNKTVTITGTADVDWSKGWFYVGRNGVGNGKVIFDGAKLTSKSNGSTYGINVSGNKQSDNKTNDVTVEIKNNSTIELDYLINKGAMTLDNSTLTVKNGFATGARPASEAGEDAVATMNLKNGSKLVVNNHNGMGLGYEALGVMNIDATSAFECTQKFLVTANGTMNIAGTATVAGTLTNNGTINLTAYDALLKTATTGLTVNTTLNDRIVVYADGAYKHGAPVVQTYKANGELVWSYSDFESAIAAATANADIARIVVNSDFTQQSVANTSNYYDIKNDLVIAAAEGQNYTVKGCGFAVRAQEGKTLTIADNLTIEGLKVVANGFATSGDNMVIDGTLKALSLKQWTNNGTITVNGKVELGYGDGQFDFAHGTNATVVINGNGDRTTPQFQAGYTTMRGAGVHTLTLNNTCFNAGSWFRISDANKTVNIYKSLVTVSADNYEFTLGAGNVINIDLESQIVAKTFKGAGTINVDTEGITENVLLIKGNLNGFTGKINVGVADYKITNEGLVVMPAVACLSLNGNNQYFAVLQDAIKACGEGDNTITLLRDVTENNVTFTQKEGVNIVLDGENNGEKMTFTGLMSVDGAARQNGTETLKIKNINFVAKAGADACIKAVNASAKYCYSHNVTVEKCSFTDPDEVVNCAAVRQPSAGCVNWTISNCTVDETMHSLIQVSNVNNLVIEKCTVESKNGINLNNSNNVTIDSNTIDVQGYALRVGASGTPAAYNYVVKNNTLKSAGEDGDAVIIFRNSATEATLSMTDNAVIGATHISGNTEATKLSIDENYWDNGDGEGDDQPTVSGNAVKVNYYYKDFVNGELLNLTRNYLSSGSIIGYIDTNRVWGEAWGNANESFVIKVLAANGDVMGTTTYKKTDLNYDKKLRTWSLYLDVDSYTGSSWDMEWTTRPTFDNLPASVQLWIDGKMLVEGSVKLNGPDGGNKINAAVYADDNTKTITAFYTTLEAAVAAGDKVAILTAGQYNVPVKDGLTVTGAVDGVEFANIGAKGMGGASVTFNNVTFTYAENSQYNGLQHAGNLVYNECTINGQVFLYGESETFNNCTFNTTDSNNYNVWTYGAKEVEFNNCTFKCAGKSVLIYAEGANVFNNVTVNGCQFDASQPVEGKAAIEMDSHRTAGIDLTINNSTVSGFGEGNVSGNSLWNNKKGNADNANNDITVTVDGEVVLGPKYEAQIGDVKHRTIQEAIDAAVKMTGDVTIEIMTGTYANDINLTNAAFDNSNNVRPNITFKPADGAEVVLSGTVTLGYRQQNVGASMWNGKVTFDGITFNHADDGKHSLVIEDVKGVDLTNCTLIGDGEYGIGSNSGNATTDATFTGCTFENGSMQVLGLLGANLVVDDCVCNDFSFNVQGGAAPGMTIKNSEFNMTLTEAHVGESFYAIRTNACPVNISETTFNVDSEVSSVAENQTKWGLFWARKDAHAEWNITYCKVNFTDAAMEQTELLLTKNDAATYTNAKDRMMITGLISTNDVEDLIKRGEGCATINGYRYLDGELDLTGMVAIIGKQVYATLEEAIAAANAGETITLLTDITSSAVIMIDKSLTIEGDNKKVTSSASRVFRVTAAGTEVVLNNVNMVSTAFSSYTSDIRGISLDANISGNKLTLNNCSVDFDPESGSDWAYAVNVSGNSSNHVVTINGGVYEGANVINVWGDNHTIVIDGATLNSLYNAPQNNYYGQCVRFEGEGCDVTIKNTEFNGIHAIAVGESIDNANGVGQDNNTDNTKLYRVKVDNGTYYHTLVEAIDAATDRATLTFLFDTEGAGAVISKNLTIDFNGKEYTFTEGGLEITAGEVTLKNGTLYASDLASALVVNGGEVKIEGDETAVSGNIEVAADATLVIYDGSYTMNVSQWCAPLHTAMPNEGATLYTIVSGITLIDGQFSEYTNDKDQDVDYIYYQRTLSSKKDSDGKYVWQAFYLPFEIPMSKLVGKYEVTYINDVRQSDSNGDGEIDGAVVEQIRIVRDNVTLKANYPYLIRPLTEEARNFVISLEDATLYKAQEVKYECSSIHTQFFFTGNVSTLDNNALMTKYALSGGKWQFGLNSMKPFRIYIEIRPKDSGEAAWIASDNYTIGMRVAGEEDETGATIIYDVVNDAQTVDYIYDLQGRRVLEPKKGGLYIINGKKVIF